MKPVVLILTLLLASVVARPQMFSGAADIVTVYSQNGQFYLKSIPYDDESPSLRKFPTRELTSAGGKRTDAATYPARSR